MNLQCYHCKRESDIHFRDFFLMQETKTGWQRIKIKDENGTHRWVVLCAKCMELVVRCRPTIQDKWNAQADKWNQWDNLSDEEKREYKKLVNKKGDK